MSSIKNIRIVDHQCAPEGINIPTSEGLIEFSKKYTVPVSSPIAEELNDIRIVAGHTKDGYTYRIKLFEKLDYEIFEKDNYSPPTPVSATALKEEIDELKIKVNELMKAVIEKNAN